MTQIKNNFNKFLLHKINYLLIVKAFKQKKIYEWLELAPHLAIIYNLQCLRIKTVPNLIKKGLCIVK